MLKNFSLSKPFFEFGPKVFLYGKRALDLALFADELCEKYNLDIIFSAQYFDIYPIVKNTKRLKVFAQHMDAVRPGRGIGAVLPEALKDVGAHGTLLNHIEKPLTLEVLSNTIQRAEEVGLATAVCAGNFLESLAIANLMPDIILAESPSTIGKATRFIYDSSEIKNINSSVCSINPKILVMHSGGIINDLAVYNIIKAGADATGTTSGVVKAENPKEMLEKMIISLVKAWEERSNGEVRS